MKSLYCSLLITLSPLALLAAEEAPKEVPAPIEEEIVVVADPQDLVDESRYQGDPARERSGFDPSKDLADIIGVQDLWEVEEIQIRDEKLHDAMTAGKGNDIENAERLYLEALNRNISSKERYRALIQLASMYQRGGEIMANAENSEAFQAYFGSTGTTEVLRSRVGGSIQHKVKAISVYEKFIALYQNDELSPLVQLQLGRLYRDIGANKVALTRFYNVMSSVLNIKPANIPAYAELTETAKMEIAQTHFSLNEFDKARNFYKQLRRISLEDDELQEVTFKAAYCAFMLEMYSDAEYELTSFLKEFPESILAPESHYILSNIYTLQNKPQDAVDAVIALLSSPQAKSVEDRSIWTYWKRRSANELANEFYEQRDFFSARKVYEAMLDLSADPEWRGPILYQIGLCLEHLEAPKKAQDVYNRIAEAKFWDEETEQDILSNYRGYVASDSVKTIQELAAWRAENLDWNMDARNRLQRLLNVNPESDS